MKKGKAVQKEGQWWKKKREKDELREKQGNKVEKHGKKRRKATYMFTKSTPNTSPSFADWCVHKPQSVNGPRQHTLLVMTNEVVSNRPVDRKPQEYTLCSYVLWSSQVVIPFSVIECLHEPQLPHGPRQHVPWKMLSSMEYPHPIRTLIVKVLSVLIVQCVPYFDDTSHDRSRLYTSV